MGGYIDKHKVLLHQLLNVTDRHLNTGAPSAMKVGLAAQVLSSYQHSVDSRIGQLLREVEPHVMLSATVLHGSVVCFVSFCGILNLEGIVSF